MPSLKVKKNGVWEYAQGGGNADTVDGKHATDFASATDFNAHTGDANNPHGVTAAMVGAAPAGLVMGVYNADTNEQINEVIITQYALMANHTVRHFNINVIAAGLELGGGVWSVTMYKTDGNYGTLTAIHYDAPSTIYTRAIIGGTWGTWSKVAPSADLTLSNLSDKQKALYNIGGRTRKNLVINPRFEVNQRNQAIYDPIQSSDAICVDRWWKTSDCTVEVLDNGIRITNRPNDYAQIYQFLPIHKAQSLVGENLTISALFNDGTLITGSGVVQQLSYDFVSVVDVGGLGLYTYMNTIRISYNLAYKPQEEVRAIKVEVGEGQTLAYQDSNGVWQLFDDYDYLSDLQECQRYFFTYYTRAEQVVLLGATALVNIKLPIGMVSNPTVTNDVTQWIVRNYANNANTSVVSAEASVSGINTEIILTLSSSLNYGVGFIENIRITLSAEL